MGGIGSGRKPQEKCGRGHELQGDNVVIVKRGDGKTERACRKCQNRRSREWWRRNRGKNG